MAIGMDGDDDDDASWLLRSLLEWTGWNVQNVRMCVCQYAGTCQYTFTWEIIIVVIMTVVIGGLHSGLLTTSSALLSLVYVVYIYMYVSRTGLLP